MKHVKAIIAIMLLLTSSLVWAIPPAPSGTAGLNTYILTIAPNTVISVAANNSLQASSNLPSGTGIPAPIITSGGLTSISFASMPAPFQFTGLTASNTSANVVTVAFTSLTMMDNAGDPAFAVNWSGTVNWAVNNAAGGTCNNFVVANNAWYGLYVVANTSAINLCLSPITSSNQATPPVGAIVNAQPYYALVGAVELTSSALLQFNQSNRSVVMVNVNYPGITNYTTYNAVNISYSIPSFGTGISGSMQSHPIGTNDSLVYLYASNSSFLGEGLFCGQGSAGVTNTAAITLYCPYTIPVITPQTIYESVDVSGGNIVLKISGWSF